MYIDPISQAEITYAVALGETPERTIWLILRDLEQEICLILALWCVLLLLNRYSLFNEDSRLISVDFLGLNSSSRDLETVSNRLVEAEKLGVSCYIILSTRIFIDAVTIVGSLENAKREASRHLEFVEETLNSRLQLINYILWAIPSVGFLGTVRGIGQALSDADQALAGDITGVALNLGIAFNSTFVALLLNLLVTFIASSLNGRDVDRLLKCRRFISENLGKKLELH